MLVLWKIRPLTFLIIYATARLTLLRSLRLGWLLTTLLCELNCARSDTKFLIAHVLVVVVAEWPWYTVIRYLSEGLMLARKNPLNTPKGPSHHLRSIFGLFFFIVHLFQVTTESQLMISPRSSLPTLKPDFSPKSILWLLLTLISTSMSPTIMTHSNV